MNAEAAFAQTLSDDEQEKLAAHFDAYSADELAELLKEAAWPFGSKPHGFDSGAAKSAFQSEPKKTPFQRVRQAAGNAAQKVKGVARKGVAEAKRVGRAGVNWVKANPGKSALVGGGLVGGGLLLASSGGGKEKDNAAMADSWGRELAHQDAAALEKTALYYDTARQISNERIREKLRPHEREFMDKSDAYWKGRGRAASLGLAAGLAGGAGLGALATRKTPLGPGAGAALGLLPGAYLGTMGGVAAHRLAKGGPPQLKEGKTKKSFANAAAGGGTGITNPAGGLMPKPPKVGAGTMMPKPGGAVGGIPKIGMSKVAFLGAVAAKAAPVMARMATSSVGRAAGVGAGVGAVGGAVRHVMSPRDPRTGQKQTSLLGSMAGGAALGAGAGLGARALSQRFGPGVQMKAWQHQARPMLPGAVAPQPAARAAPTPPGGPASGQVIDVPFTKVNAARLLRAGSISNPW